MATTLDINQLKAPPQLDNATATPAPSKDGMIQVTVDGKKIEVYRIEFEPKKEEDKSVAILFLHGMKFSSQNWKDIETVYHVSSWGFKAVAVDLPGYGKCVKENKVTNCAEFMTSLISALGLSQFVIVSPSMSGRFSLPYLFEDGNTSTQKAMGYVPVAPIETEHYVAEYKKSQLSTLIVCGTEDKLLGEISNRSFSNLPKGQFALMEGAGHACYLDNPDAFHKFLYHFLMELTS